MLREHRCGRQVLLVHRPRYGDWSLPKGKIRAHESLQATAVREVTEETGVRIRLGHPLTKSRYLVGKHTKDVFWWTATPVKIGRWEPNHEIDQRKWVPLDKAAQMLSYRDEKAVLDQARLDEETVALIVLRHALALDRAEWAPKLDSGRPLTQRGERQAQALIDKLGYYGVGRVVTSTSRRCVDTVSPFIEASGVKKKAYASLSEESAEASPEMVAEVMAKIKKKTLKKWVPTVVCGHRPVLPEMYQELGVGAKALKIAEMDILHFNRDAQIVARETLMTP